MGTARLKLYIDLQRRALVKSDRDGREVNMPDLRQYDAIEMELVLLKFYGLQPGRRIFPADTSIRAAVGSPGSDELARSAGFTTVPSQAEDEEPKNRFQGQLRLNTDRMATALGNNPGIDRRFEISAAFGGNEVTLIQVPVRVWATVTGNANLLAEDGSVLLAEDGSGLLTQSQERVTLTTPEFYDKGQMDARYAGFQLGAGEGLTFTDIDGSYKGTIYLDNVGNFQVAS